MPFITRSQIPDGIRKPYEDAYRDNLRQRLLDPTLTLDQKATIKIQLKALQSPKSGATYKV